MKLEKLGEALAIANEYGLDGIDVAILAAVVEKRRTEGAACPRCGADIAGTRVNQRGTYYCPRCQRRGSLGKDRRGA